VAAAVVVFMFEAIRFRWGNGFFWPDGGFEYPLWWSIVAFSFVIRGGGPYSLDAWLGKEV
jgi:putative oxidoreductase